MVQLPDPRVSDWHLLTPVISLKVTRGRRQLCGMEDVMRFIALLLLLPLAAPALAQDGAALFTAKACSVCHAIGVDPPDRLGPHLNGVVGRTIGGLKDYAYSPALGAAREAGQVWTPELLLQYLKKPAHAFPGTSMAYAGMADRAEIDALIQYLAGFADDGSAVP
jgi:cytochrome c2